MVKAKNIIEEIMFDMQSVVNEVHKPSVQLMNISNGGYEFNVYFWLYTISEVSSSNVKTQAMIQIVEKLSVAGFALGNSKED